MIRYESPTWLKLGALLNIAIMDQAHFPGPGLPVSLNLGHFLICICKSFLVASRSSIFRSKLVTDSSGNLVIILLATNFDL